MSDWRTQYEVAAEQEAARLARASDRELLEMVKTRKTGGYFALWRILGARAPTPEICWRLYDVLVSDRDYLDRYHCADALLKLLRCSEFEAVQLSADWPAVPGNLQILRGIVERAVGTQHRR
jgi:hypothetical protein